MSDREQPMTPERRAKHIGALRSREAELLRYLDSRPKTYGDAEESPEMIERRALMWVIREAAALQKRVAELEGERDRVIASVGKIAFSLGDAVSRRRWGQVDAAGDRLDGVLGMLRKASEPTDGEAG